MKSFSLPLTNPGALLSRLMSNRFVRHVGWLAGAQVIGRVARLLITLVMARTLMPEDYGLLAIIFTSHELLFTLLRRSTQTRIIQASDSELPRLCATAYSLNGLLGISLCLLQSAVALLLGQAYANPALVLPLIFLSLIYLQLPFAMIQAALNIRAGQLALVARIEALQSLLEAMLAILLLMLGAGLWALVIPKVLVTGIWIVLHRQHSDWRPPRRLNCTGWQGILGYAGQIVGADLLQVLRNNADYLLIGHFLGLEALGLYFFAYNAGLGIALQLTSALNTALLPYLCAAQRENSGLSQRFRQGLVICLLLITGLVILQTSLAEEYVPLIFGERWVEQGCLPLIIILCLSAIPRAIIDAGSQLLRAAGRPTLDLKSNACICAAMLVAISLGVHWELAGVAWATLLAYALLAPGLLFTCYQAVVEPAPSGKQTALLPCQQG